MKNIKSIFSSLLVLGVMYSCQDATDIIQVGELSEEVAFQTIADLESGLSGAYSFYSPDQGGNGGGNSIFLNAIYSDNVKAGIASNGQGAAAYQYVVDNSAGSPSANVWTNRYSMINQINRVLRASGNLNFNDEDEARQQAHINGQLFALRALAHMELFEYYTVDYQNPSSLAVINVDFVPEIDVQLERNTVQQTVAFIREDLARATANLDPDVPNNPIFINQDFVDFMTIKMDLLTNDFDGSTMAIADDLLAKYPLSDVSTYPSIWSDNAFGEGIFTLARGLDDEEVVTLFYFNFVSQGDAFIEVSNELYNLLNELPGDVRLNSFVDSSISVINGVNDPTNEIYLGKYPGSIQPEVNDIKVARSSEVLMMKAEMQARSNDLTGAALSVQQLRDARTGSTGTPPVYTNTLMALTDILKERQREFCFEGKRFLDIKRFDYDLNAGLNREPVDCQSFEAPCAIPANDFRYTLAIPQTEIFGNNVITQNPGYPTN